jgi:hypothetical protein
MEFDGDSKGRPASYLRPRREKFRIITYQDSISENALIESKLNINMLVCQSGRTNRGTLFFNEKSLIDNL